MFSIQFILIHHYNYLLATKKIFMTHRTTQSTDNLREFSHHPSSLESTKSTGIQVTRGNCEAIKRIDSCDVGGCGTQLSKCCSPLDDGPGYTNESYAVDRSPDDQIYSSSSACLTNGSPDVEIDDLDSLVRTRSVALSASRGKQQENIKNTVRVDTDFARQERCNNVSDNCSGTSSGYDDETYSTSHVAIKSSDSMSSDGYDDTEYSITSSDKKGQLCDKESRCRARHLDVSGKNESNSEKVVLKECKKSTDEAKEDQKSCQSGVDSFKSVPNGNAEIREPVNDVPRGVARTPSETSNVQKSLLDSNDHSHSCKCSGNLSVDMPERAGEFVDSSHHRTPARPRGGSQGSVSDDKVNTGTTGIIQRLVSGRLNSPNGIKSILQAHGGLLKEALEDSKSGVKGIAKAGVLPSSSSPDKVYRAMLPKISQMNTFMEKKLRSKAEQLNALITPAVNRLRQAHHEFSSHLHQHLSVKLPASNSDLCSVRCACDSAMFRKTVSSASPCLSTFHVHDLSPSQLGQANESKVCSIHRDDNPVICPPEWHNEVTKTGSVSSSSDARTNHPLQNCTTPSSATLQSNAPVQGPFLCQTGPRLKNDADPKGYSPCGESGLQCNTEKQENAVIVSPARQTVSREHECYPSKLIPCSSLGDGNDVACNTTQHMFCEEDSRGKNLERVSTNKNIGMQEIINSAENDVPKAVSSPPSMQIGEDYIVANRLPDFGFDENRSCVKTGESDAELFKKSSLALSNYGSLATSKGERTHDAPPKAAANVHLPDSLDEPFFHFDNWIDRFTKTKARLDNQNFDTSYSAHFKMFANMKALAQDFNACVRNYAPIIISELFLPDEKKSLKKARVGGIIGGEKYIIHNILFKLAENKKMFVHEENAKKIASHEFKSLIKLLGCNQTHFIFPFMAMIDYRGFRLLAISMLPISSATIAFGSDDGGATVLDDTAIEKKVLHLGKMLNLKAHHVSKNHVLTAMPADVEIHRVAAADGSEKLYMVDLSRLIPPTAPAAGVKGAHLFQLFRSEFLAKYRVALSSDGFSSFASRDTDELANEAEQNKEEIRTATACLLDEHIPGFVRSLLSIPTCIRDDITLTFLMHRNGVNMRYLGVVFSVLLQQLQEETSDTVLYWVVHVLVEMISRVLKVHINEMFRSMIQRLQPFVDRPYRVMLVCKLNEAFTCISSASRKLWDSIINDIEEKFSPVLFEKQEGVGEQLFNDFVILSSQFCGIDGRCLLFRRLTESLGLCWADDVYRDASTDSDFFDTFEPFSETDFVTIHERLRELDISYLATGITNFSQSLYQSARHSKSRLLTSAIESFKKALEMNPTNRMAMCCLGDAYASLGKTELASYYYSEAAHEQYYPALVRHGMLLEKASNVEEAELAYISALQSQDQQDRISLQLTDGNITEVSVVQQAERTLIYFHLSCINVKVLDASLRGIHVDGDFSGTIVDQRSERYRELEGKFTTVPEAFVFASGYFDGRVSTESNALQEGVSRVTGELTALLPLKEDHRNFMEARNSAPGCNFATQPASFDRLKHGFIEGHKNALGTPACIYADFLFAEKKDYILADKLYSLALKMDKTSKMAINNYAVFLAVVRREYEKASVLFESLVSEPDVLDFQTIYYLQNYIGILN